MTPIINRVKRAIQQRVAMINQARMAESAVQRAQRMRDFQNSMQRFVEFATGRK